MELSRTTIEETLETTHFQPLTDAPPLPEICLTHPGNRQN